MLKSSGKHSVEVVVRVRPQQSDVPLAPTYTISDDTRTIAIRQPQPGKEMSYKFNTVFGPEAQQEDIYAPVSGFVEAAVKGENATIFAYGSTGSGKTHTMQGTPDNPGVILRSVKTLLALVERQKIEGKWTDHKVSVAYFELYKEKVNDLIDQKNRDLPIRETRNGSITIPGLAKIPITTMAQFQVVLEDALSKRQVAATNLNSQSSRSHAILLVEVTKVLAENPVICVGSKLHLIDLAGSEDNRKTGNRGDSERISESAAINSSLFTLSKVLDAINKKQQRIPYRDSKLTRLLQDSLGGGARSCVVVCVDPKPESLGETHNSLKFASKAKEVVNVSVSRVTAPVAVQRSSGKALTKLPFGRARLPNTAGRPSKLVVRPKKQVLAPPLEPGVNVDVKVLSQIEQNLAALSSNMRDGPDAATEARLARLEKALLGAPAASPAAVPTPVPASTPSSLTIPPKILDMTPATKLKVAKAKIMEAKAYEKIDTDTAIKCYEEAAGLLPKATQLKVHQKIEALLREKNPVMVCDESMIVISDDDDPESAKSAMPRRPLQSVNQQLPRGQITKLRQISVKRRAADSDSDSDEWVPPESAAPTPSPAPRAKKRKVGGNATSHWQPGHIVMSAIAGDSAPEHTDRVHLVEESRALLLSALNTASVKQLMTLKLIGKKRAESIVQYRDAERNFNALEDLRDCGMGANQIKNFLTENASAATKCSIAQ